MSSVRCLRIVLAVLGCVATLPGPGRGDKPLQPAKTGKISEDRALQLFRKLDANGDGKISGDEAAGEAGKRFLRLYDKNGDGIVTLEEVTGKPAPASKTDTPKTSATGTSVLPEPPVCYDITKSFPQEIGQYRVSRAARNHDPFEILDGLYYVGNTQVSAYLLTCGKGLILIDSTMPHEVPWLLQNVQKLGYRPSDVKVVIGTHAHLDHIGGHWYFQKHFGAQTWLQVEDAGDTESGAYKPGGAPLPLDGGLASLSRAFPPFKTDRPLRDGEVVDWGNRKLTFRRAPGHTAGTLMIEFPLQGKDGKTYRAGLLGGVSPGRSEFTETCKQLRKLDVDICLSAHPDQTKMLEKAQRLKAGQANPFLDPQDWKNFLDKMIARDKRTR